MAQSRSAVQTVYSNLSRRPLLALLLSVPIAFVLLNILPSGTVAWVTPSHGHPPELSWSQTETEDSAEFAIRSVKEWADTPSLTTSRYLHAESYNPTPSLPYTAAIIWLTRLSKLWDTAASMETVVAHMPMNQAYPFLLLHDGDLSSPSLQEDFLAVWEKRADRNIREGRRDLGYKMRVVAGLVEFPVVNMDAPPEIARLGLSGLGNVVWDDRWPGYHSMCRFFSGLVFTHPRVGQFTYYMRMDTDSYLLSSMSHDPFEHMHRSSLIYAWRNEGTDPENVVDGLRDFMDQFMWSHGNLHIPDNLQHYPAVSKSENGGRFPMYDTNWEIVHVPSFRRPDVNMWIERMMENPRIFYQKRFGDAPLRQATVAMFFPPHQVQQFCAFAYRHGGSLYEAEPSCEM